MWLNYLGHLLTCVGNDQDEDGQPTAPPVDVADKPAARKGKRDAPTEAPTSSTRGGGSAVRGARGRGRGNATGSEGGSSRTAIF